MYKIIILFLLILISCSKEKSITTIDSSVLRSTAIVSSIDNSSLLIFDSIKKNDIEAVRELIAQQIFLDIENESHETPLCVAIDLERIDIAILLIENGADVNFASNSSVPIVYAARNNNIGLIKILLNAGANINSTSRYANMSGGSSAILEAIINCNFEIVDFLLDNGADINLGTYIEGDGAAIILISKRNSLVKSETYDNDLEMLDYIFENGFDVEQECYFGNALSVAVYSNDIEAIKVLFKYKANPEKYIDEIVMTIYQYAISKENEEIIKLFVAEIKTKT